MSEVTAPNGSMRSASERALFEDITEPYRPGRVKDSLSLNRTNPDVVPGSAPVVIVGPLGRTIAAN